MVTLGVVYPYVLVLKFVLEVSILLSEVHPIPAIKATKTKVVLIRS